MTTITKPSAPIQTSRCATQQIAQNKTVGKTKLFSPLTPKDLVPRLGTSEDMVRIFLRKNYPQIYVKNRAWNISSELAKQIENDYKNQVKAREAEKTPYRAGAFRYPGITSNSFATSLLDNQI